VADALAATSDLNQIIGSAADHLGLAIPNPVIYWLTQTTMLACLASLRRSGQASVGVVANRLGWEPVTGH
jgi:hypothetical protein